MKMNIEMIAGSLKWEAENFRAEYDKVEATRKRELQELEANYRPDSKKLISEKERLNSACDAAITKLRVQAAERGLKDVGELKRQEREKVQDVDVSLLAKIQAIKDIPVTALELNAFADKLNVRNNYMASRMLANISQQWGIDESEIGITPTYDTKMNILDNLVEQLDKVIMNYGTIDREESQKTKFLYLSDGIIENAIQAYNGKVNSVSDDQLADRVYLTVKTQHTDIQKGIAISNVLRNIKSEVKNKILAKLAEDNSISSAAAKISGHMDEIASFKNGLAAEYRSAENAIKNICKMKDKTAIVHTVAEYVDNCFFKDMLEREEGRNSFLSEALHGKTMNDNSEME